METLILLMYPKRHKTYRIVAYNDRHSFLSRLERAEPIALLILQGTSELLDNPLRGSLCPAVNGCILSQSFPVVHGGDVWVIPGYVQIAQAIRYLPEMVYVTWK